MEVPDNMPVSCTIDFIQNYLQYGFDNQCQFVEKYCDNKDGYQFLQAYYCVIGESTLMLIIFSAIFCFVAFHLLSSTAENYLSPALTNISNKLGLSETLAGVTLVAIGNGAPDVIVAISASSGGGDADDDDDGVSFTIGSIFGAGLFVTTMCLALVLVKSGGGLEPNKSMFLRDMSFYMLAVITIIIYGFIGRIYWYMAVIFICIYIFYIIIVIIMERSENKKQLDDQPQQQIEVNQTQSEMLEAKLYTEDEMNKQQNRNSQSESENENDETQQQQENSNNNEEEKESVKVQKNQTLIIQEGNNNIRVSINDDGNLDGRSESEQLSPVKYNLGQQSSEQSNSNKITLSEIVKQDHYKSSGEISKLQKGDIIQDKQQNKAQSFFKLRHNIRLKLLKVKTEWVDLEFEDKLIYIWEIPADFIRNITISPSEENWKRWRAMASCIFGPIFFLVSGFLPEEVFDPFDGSIWWIYVILGSIGLIFALLVWKTSHKSNPPSYVWVFSTLAFIISIAWINAVADYLIEFLSFIQIITEINKVYLGMTFLAYGNSAGDYFTNGQLATMGYGNMALTACYAGQLFNLLIGFGLTMIINSTSKEGMDFDLFGFHTTQNTSQKIGGAIGYCIVFCALVNVIIMITYSFIKKFVYGKSIGNFLRMFYLLVIIGATVMGIASDIVKPDFTVLKPFINAK